MDPIAKRIIDAPRIIAERERAKEQEKTDKKIRLEASPAFQRFRAWLGRKTAMFSTVWMRIETIRDDLEKVGHSGKHAPKLTPEKLHDHFVKWDYGDSGNADELLHHEFRNRDQYSEWKVTLGEAELTIHLDETADDENIEFCGELTVLATPSSDHNGDPDASHIVYDSYRWVVFGSTKGEFFELKGPLQPCDYFGLLKLLEDGVKPVQTTFDAVLEDALNDLVTLGVERDNLETDMPGFACQLRVRSDAEKPAKDILQKLGTTVDEIKRLTGFTNPTPHPATSSHPAGVDLFDGNE